MPKDLPISDISLQVTEGTPVAIPSADLLMNANFIKDGANLVLQGKDGSSVTVEGYFNTLEAPDLTGPGGIRISSDLVESFAKSVHAGKYAEAGDTMNDVSPIGQIAEIVGTVIVTRADGTEIVAEAGTVLHQGDVIETSADGAANIVFADNTNFAISEDARLSVDEFAYDTETQDGSSFFSMLKGAFVYTSGMIGKGDPGDVNIETPAGSIGIRGTVVMGKIDPEGQNSEITVLDGAVIITNAGGMVELNQSFETVKLTGYDVAPQFMGQINAADAQSAYQSLSGVAGTTFNQAFTPSNDTNSQATQQQGENEGETQLNPENSGEDSGSQDAPSSEEGSGDSTENSTQDTSESVSTPTNFNDSTTNSGTTGTSSNTGTNTNSTTSKSSSSSSDTQQTQETSIRPALINEDDDENEDPRNPDEDDPTTKDGIAFSLKELPQGERFLVREFEDAGFKIGNVTVEGDNVTGVQYSIVNDSQFYDTETGGTVTGIEAFTIDPNTGEIFVNDSFALNGGLNNSFTLDILATNSNGDESLKSFTVEMELLLPETALRTTGTTGNDQLYTTADTTGQEIVYGGLGNDTLIDNTNHDTTLIGGGGDNLFKISNTAGAQTMIGGTGNDTFEIHVMDALDSISGGGGHDVLKLTNQGNDMFDLRGGNSSNIEGISGLALNNTTLNMMEVYIDDAAIENLVGPDTPLIITAGNAVNVHVTLEGDWERLTNYDNNFFNGQDSAAYRNIETGKLVVAAESAASVNFIESSTNAAVNADDGSTMLGDIPLLDDLSNAVLPPAM